MLVTPSSLAVIQSALPGGLLIPTQTCLLLLALKPSQCYMRVICCHALLACHIERLHSQYEHMMQSAFDVLPCSFQCEPVLAYMYLSTITLLGSCVVAMSLFARFQASWF